MTKQERELLQQRAAELYKTGLSLTEVGAKIGIPFTTVHRWIKKLGVAPHKLGDWHKGKTWTESRRAHHPAKPVRDPDAPSGYDILSARALGNKSIRKNGYVLVSIGRKQRRYEHDLIAEAALGRPLTSNEVVHHINCVKHDNRPANLLICTREYHLKLHAKMRRDPYWAEIERRAKESPTTSDPLIRRAPWPPLICTSNSLTRPESTPM